MLEVLKSEQKFYNWWRELNKEYNKNLLVGIKKCSRPEKILFQPAYALLCQRYLGDNGDFQLKEDSHLFAGLLAHVKTNNNEQKFREQLSRVKSGPNKSMLINEIRFKRMMSCDTLEELYPHLLRCIKMLEEVNVVSLCRDLIYWNNPRYTKRDWALAYYSKFIS